MNKGYRPRISLSDFSCVGFSGSRDGGPQDLIAGVVGKVRSDALICVGCAKGVDAQVRSLCHDRPLKIFKASEYPGANYAVKLANRSSALVGCLIINNGILIAFPNAACPSGVEPCQRWRSAKGSGTWGTIALAVGRGLTTIVHLPGALAPPDWVDRLNGDWYFYLGEKR